ncbi:MAG: transcriptional repressor LexA [Candidatus Omnitrophota bacterium]|nr:transcriptional repressor LexA [Candidatus Omnitrophota bacterium]
MIKRDAELYAHKINNFYMKNRRMPSYSEMQSIFGFASKNAVFKRVQALMKNGFIDKDAKGRLIPRSLVKPARLLGTVAAGFPSPAEEELADTMSLDEYLISNPQATYLLKVDGDSMIDAGVHPGDLVLVQRNLTPKTGDIVVAHVDNEWTLKYFEKKGGRVVLKAANKKYPVITPKQELTIAGVVIANVRKYR